MKREEDWVLGIELPPALSLTAEGRLTDEIAAFVAGELRRRRNSEPAIGAVVTENRRMYFGVPQEHHHPNCFGSAVEVAVGIACTSGYHRILGAALFDPERRPGQAVYSGVDSDRLSEHFPVGKRDMDVVTVFSDSYKLQPYLELWSLPYGGNKPAQVQPEPFAATEQLCAEFVRMLTPAAIHGAVLPKAIVKYMERKLRMLIQNSTGDGKTRPGRKRHAAGVVTRSGRVYYGVNLRSEAKGADRCSEWNALGAAFTGGDDRSIVACFLFSPDYGDRGLLTVCGKCKNALSGCIDAQVGDVLIYFFENVRPTRRALLTHLRDNSYASAEGC